jgi:hypothetical protein
MPRHRHFFVFTVFLSLSLVKDYSGAKKRALRSSFTKLRLRNKNRLRNDDDGAFFKGKHPFFPTAHKIKGAHGVTTDLEEKIRRRAIAHPSETLPISGQNFALNRVISSIQ